MSFEQFNLRPRVAAGVQAVGFSTPTPIQKQAIPSVMQGRDVMGLAQTGTGKTAAFVLPMLDRLLEGPRGRVRALVIAPTRELAEQIHEEIGRLGQATKLRSATVYGGVGMNPQKQALRGRAEIIVACPGRLLDHLQQGNADLSSVELLVLDEADHMFDMGFLPDIRRIVGRLPKNRQTLLFSATMPGDIRKLAGEVLKNPLTVEVATDEPLETVSHSLYLVEKDRKAELLKHLLRQLDPRSALIFTRTKHQAKRLAQALDKDNYFATSLQGNLSQNKRQQALDGFKRGKFHILVATDIAARGIDVSKVSHVINYDIPNTVETYTHRIGRTGRAQNTGEAFTFVTPEDEGMVRSIERKLGMRIERVEVDGFGYDRPAARSPEQGRGSRPKQGRQGSGRKPTGGWKGGRSAAKGSSGRSRSRHASGRPSPQKD
ncbi:MAG TPA: DEAD/DEAH box helicase [Trueperaceae bacterium]